MASGYSGNSAPRTKALDHSKVASTHKPSGKPSPIMPLKKYPLDKIANERKPSPTMPTKRPMAGNDAAFNKKYGSASHNNGMTN